MTTIKQPDDTDFVQTYSDAGWAVAEIFEPSELEEFSRVFHDLLKMQMRKMGIAATGDVGRDVVALNGQGSRFLSECLVMARNTAAGHRLAGSARLNALSRSLLAEQGEASDTLLVSGPSFFVNIPQNNQRKYTWHSEQSWYPKRRNFLNVWCPILADRMNGSSMAVMSGSHKKDWFYFSEYTGYDGEFVADANVQYEIPESFVTDYQSVVPDVKQGHGLFFNGKLVHRSLDLPGSTPYFTMVFRVFDYAEDLTLSADWADIPYNRKSLGFPEINVSAA